MRRAEDELKSVNTNVQGNKEKQIKTEKVDIEVKEQKVESVTDNVTNEQELDWDQDIPF